MTLSVLERDAALPWLDQVCRAADANTHELGFFPRNVFTNFARRGLLNVLVDTDASGQSRYAGHLLFEARYPRAHIRQMFIDPSFRRGGRASRLLCDFITSLAAAGFIAIYARVGEDLAAANAFWERHQFVVLRIDAGGSSKKRKVLIRCRELDSPQLFPPSRIDDANPLGLIVREGVELPLFLLDLNVLFDVSKPRRPRREQVAGLLQAERMNFCRLAISDEIRNELKRTSLGGRDTDPMAGFVELFPAFPLTTSTNDVQIANLAKLVFRGVCASRALNANELSDLRHLACAINNDLAGLITNDEALLEAAPAIQREYRVEVVPSGYFESAGVTATEGRSFDSIDRSRLDLLPVRDGQETAIRTLLSQRVGLSGSELATQWFPYGAQSRVASSQAVWCDQQCVGFITRVNKSSGGIIAVRAAVDPSHPQALGAARILLLDLVDGLAVQKGHCQVRLEVPSRQASLREIASGLGFVGSADGHFLAKSILGRVITPMNWASCHAVLADIKGPKLPTAIPDYQGYDQRIPVLTADGNRTHVPLERLESLLCPALFCLPGRPAVLVPIERRFAEPLLGHSPQLGLLSLGSASLFRERLYLSDPKTLPRFKRGMLIFFYESKKGHGSQQIVAIARVREAFLRPSDTFDQAGLERSVLTTEHLPEIGKASMKTVTLFDNIFRLPSPVGLETLRRLNCGRGNDLITAKLLTSEQARGILEAGFPT